MHRPFVTFLMTLMVAAAPAFAQATVVEEFSCTIIPADSGLSIPLQTTDTHHVTTPSGNTSMTCHFVIPEEEIPDKTMHHAGFACGTFEGITTDSRSVTATDGTVTLTCQIKANAK